MEVGSIYQQATREVVDGPSSVLTTRALSQHPQSGLKVRFRNGDEAIQVWLLQNCQSVQGSR
jgi:hypothetical protein